MALVENQVAATELERVLPKVRRAFEYDDKFWATVEKKNVEKISNRQMRIPIELRPGGKFKYFNPNGGDLGRGGGPTYDKAVVQSVFMAEAIEYTKLADWSTDSDRKAVINAVRKLTTNATLEIRRQLDSQSMQAGTGVIGTVLTDTPAGGFNVIVLTNEFGARLMRFDQEVQIYDTTLATPRGSATITKWDVANNTIELFPQIAGVVATDVIVTAGISAPASLPALFGVPYHHSNASTGNWLGMNRATTPEIRSNRVNANNNPFTLPLPRLAVNYVGNRIGLDENFKPVAWMHPCQKQAYEEIGQLVSIIQKSGSSPDKMDMYFDKFQMAGMSVRESFSWSKTRIDVVNLDVWGRGETLPLGFYTSDGRKIFEIRGASGGVATSEIFYMVCGTQLFVTNPAATAYIDNLSVPAGY
jgi:hypothetical protein